MKRHDYEQSNNLVDVQNNHQEWRRRNLISFILTSTSGILQLSQKASATISTTSSSTATTTTTTPAMTQTQIQNFLNSIPTFCIVDTKGVPFTVVGEDAKLTSYFFITFEEADRILKLARDSSDRAINESLKETNEERKKRKEKPIRKGTKEMEDEIGINPWNDARISTVPLDFAVTLAIKRKIGGAYFRVAPDEDDVKDALKINKLNDLEEGKVPLFYFEDFTIEKEGTESIDKTFKTPLYFTRPQLISQYKKQQGNENIPDIKTTELFTLLSKMASSSSANDIDELLNLVIIPPESSPSKQKQCIERGGKEEAYKLGERIVVL